MSDLTKIKELVVENIVLAVFALITLLLLAVWQAVPSSVWDRVSEAVPKRALWALLGLAGITICLLGSALIDIRRKKKLTAAEPELLKRFGVLWDNELNPHCPADQTLMRPRVNTSGRDHDILMCPKCDHTFPLRTDDNTSPLLLPDAKSLIRHPPLARLPEPKMLKQFGLLWDDAQNPHCPVDATLLQFHSAAEATTSHGNYDRMHCPACKEKFIVWDAFYGHMTLYAAQNFIREQIRRSIKLEISD
jgi:uncharacterized protein YbaR (Trm112 family)